MERLIKSIASYSVPRSLKSSGLGEFRCVEVHGFGDSSTKAYSAVVYVTMRYDAGARTSLAQGKARVAPLRPNNRSVPDLELTSDAVLVELVANVLAELRWEIPRDKIFIGQIVLLYCP